MAHVTMIANVGAVKIPFLLLNFVNFCPPDVHWELNFAKPHVIPSGVEMDLASMAKAVNVQMKGKRTLRSLINVQSLITVQGVTLFHKKV